MEDLNVGLLHLTLTKTLEILRAGDVVGTELILDDLCITLEIYLDEGK